MEADPKVSFENTAVAFRYKSNASLRKANFIFSLVNHPWISSVATGLVKAAFKLHLPIDAIVRKTVFDHFCGGESLEKSDKAIAQLAQFNVHTILDYSVEGEKTEEGFENTVAETLRTIEKSQTNSNIPFAVFKVTGLAPFELLEKVQRNDALNQDEKERFERVRSRVRTICEAAFRSNVPVLIDAEESWIQDPIDKMSYEMMALFNREKAIVYNTFQLYRTDSLANLKEAFRLAGMSAFVLGA